MRAFLHMEIGLPCRAGDAQGKEVLTMNWEYELACREAGMSEEEIRNTRKIFDADRKALKRENELIEQQKIIVFSIDANRDKYNEALNVPDKECNVEEEAIYAVELERLMECLDRLTDEEREVILALYDPTIKYEQYARDRGVPQSTLRRRAERIFQRLKKMMGVES